MSLQSRLSDLITAIKGDFNGLDGRVTTLENAGSASTFQINKSGRMYCYSDARWVTNSDDNYGATYYQWQESGGTGADPIQEVEHKGEFVRAGTIVKEFSMFGRGLDVNTVSDIEVMITYTNPNGRWDGIGLDSDGEDSHTTLHRSFWLAGGSGNPDWSNVPINDHLRRTFNCGDFVVPADGDLRIYLKPVNVDPRPNTTTDYAQFSNSWLLQI